MSSIKTITAIISSCVLQFSAQAQVPVDSYLEHLYNNQKFSGSVAISFKDSIIYAKSVGLADVSSNKAIDLNTKFRIGSITKTYTATMLLKAIEEGKIKLDDRLSKWYPQFENADKITIEMLLKHRSGLFNFTEIPGETEWESVAHSQAEFIDYVSKPANNFAPNADYEYSNTNYALLGFILEKIYNSDYNEILQTIICKPLGLKNTYYTFENNLNNNEADSYNIQKQFIKNGAINYSNEPGSGGLLSNPTEVNQFVSALFKGKIISNESLEMMLPKEKGTYGFGINKMSFSNLEAYKHDGRIDNYISDYWYFPNEELGLVTLANATNINTDAVQFALLQYAYGNKPKITDYDQIDGLSKDDFLKIKGTYFYPDKKQSITISSNGENLIFQDSRAGQMFVPFTYLGKNKFEFEDIVLTFNSTKQEVTQEQGEYKFVLKK